MGEAEREELRRADRYQNALFDVMLWLHCPEHGRMRGRLASKMASKIGEHVPEVCGSCGKVLLIQSVEVHDRANGSGIVDTKTILYATRADADEGE